MDCSAGGLRPPAETFKPAATMSYLQFHVVFTIPALILMRAIQPSIVLSDRRKANLSVGAIAVIAFLYTTPWDNFLVANNIWYYGTDRVIGIIGHVPYEEYAFFLIQTFITGLWTFWLLHRPGARWFNASASQAARFNGTGFFLVASALGFWLLEGTSTMYMGLIVAWAAPVLALQWVVGGQHLWKMQKLVLTAFIPPSIYLCFADAFAIWNGVWVISEETSTGVMIGILPIEEALFFFVTNLLVVQGALLGAHQLRHSRLAPLRKTVADVG